jgi:hypothetical protein
MASWHVPARSSPRWPNKDEYRLLNIKTGKAQIFSAQMIEDMWKEAVRTSATF